MIPATITHLQAPPFTSENEVESEVSESASTHPSTHPCHRLSIPAARLFWCRHCMQIFEDPITRWRHSKTCLQSCSGKVKKDKDGTTMQVFLNTNNLSELCKEQKSRAVSRSSGPGHSPGTDLKCFICKTTFLSIDEMRIHVRNPCRKRPQGGSKHKFSTLPTEVKTQIQIPDTASEIIYIKDGHQTVISLESPCAADLMGSEFIETSQDYEPSNISGTEEMIIFPDTFDTTTNLNAIEQTVEISAVETVIPFTIRTEEVTKQQKNRTENKENNIRKRKRILPKEIDDRPIHKISNAPKSDPQITLSLPTKPDDVRDILDDSEASSTKISKITNRDSEDEIIQNKVQVKPLQTKEESSQLSITEKKDVQLLTGEEHLPNGIITEQVADEDILLEAPASPVEKVVTGDAAEAKLKDLFTEIEMRNKSKLPSSPTQTTVNSPKKSSYKRSSPIKIRNNDIDKSPKKEQRKYGRQSNILQEAIDSSGLLLHMPPINARSVTLPDPLLGLRSGLPAEMLLDETTNTKSSIYAAPEAINTFVPSEFMAGTKLPSHIFDGDLSPSPIHSELLFEEVIHEHERPCLVDNQHVRTSVSTENNHKGRACIDSTVDIVEEEIEVPPVEIYAATAFDHLTLKILKDSESVQVQKESVLAITESSEKPNQEEDADSTETKAKTKTDYETDEEEESDVTAKTKAETKNKSAKPLKCKACNNIFKTLQALQKHSRFPCILKHTRSLSQKILRPKQPILKIEKKPLKKKLVKTRRQKLMIPIMPITRHKMLQPAVPKRPKRFSRRKKRRSFFMDEQNRILPYVNVLMSELSDKDRFFYKLGMLNQYHNTPSSETTMTAPNAEAPAVETSGDSTESPSSTFRSPGKKTESVHTPEIEPLSPATDMVTVEPQGIENTTSSAIVAACISEKENMPALTKGLCLSLPTLEKMEHSQFHDPNCISSSHVDPAFDEPPKDPSGAAGQSVQSPCSAAVPGITSTNSSSADMLNRSDTITKPCATRESAQSCVLANRSLSFSNSSVHCGEQSKKISKETVDDSDAPISGHSTVENLTSKCGEIEKVNSKELENIVENDTSQLQTISGQSASLQALNLKEQSYSDAAQKDNFNSAENTLDKKVEPKSARKMIERTDEEEKEGFERIEPSKRDISSTRVISPDKMDQSRSSVNRNLTDSKLDHSRTAGHDVMKSVNLSSNLDTTNDRNRKRVDSCAASNIEKTKPNPPSVDSNASNIFEGKSSTLSKDVEHLSTKKMVSRNSIKKITSIQESPISATKVPSNQKSPRVTTTSSEKVPSNEESPMFTAIPLMKMPSNQESHVFTTTLDKKVFSNQDFPRITPDSGKKERSKLGSSMVTATLSSNLESQPSTISVKTVHSNQESPMIINSSFKKVYSTPESPIVTNTTSKTVHSNQKSPMITATRVKKVPSNLESPVVTTTSDKIQLKKIPSNLGASVTSTTSGKRAPSNQESPIITASLGNSVLSNQVSPITTTSKKESPMITTTSVKKVPSNQESPMITATSGKGVCSNQETPIINSASGKRVPSNEGSPTITSTSSEKVLSNKESPIITTTSGKRVPSNLQSPMITTSSKKVSSNRESHNITTSSVKKEPLNPESPMPMNSPCKIVPSSQESQIANPITSKNSTKPTFSFEKVISKENFMNSDKRIVSNTGTPKRENTKLVSLRENSPELGLSNDDQNQTLTLKSTLLTLTSPNKKAVYGHISDSIADQNRSDPQSLDNKTLPYSQNLSETRTHEDQGQGDQSGEPVEILELQDKIAQPILKSLHIDTEETQTSLDVNSDERERHFSDIFGHEKNSLHIEDLNKNYQISPSKERSKRHFTDFLSGVSEKSSTSQIGRSDMVHTGSFVERMNIEYMKTKEMLAKSVKDPKHSQKSSEIGSDNKLPISRVSAGSCGKQDSQELGNKHLVKKTESPQKSVVVNTKLEKNMKASPKSGELDSVSTATELLARESLLNSGSVDLNKTETTAVVTITNPAVTTSTNCSVNKANVTISSPTEYKAPSQNSEIPLNVSTTETSSPRVSISTQTDSSFIKDLKSGLIVPSGPSDLAEKTELQPSSVSMNPDPPPPSSDPINPVPHPQSPITESNPIIVDNVPSPVTLSEGKSEELVQDNFHLDPSGLHLPQEIIINDTSLSTVSSLPPGTPCEPVQDDSWLQQGNTEASVLLQQQSIPDPSCIVDTESPSQQQLIVDNTIDPNVLVQYLSNMDPSLLQQGVTYVVIQGEPGDGLPLTDDHNLIIEQPEPNAEQDSADGSVFYTLHFPPESDITTEAEYIMADSS